VASAPYVAAGASIVARSRMSDIVELSVDLSEKRSGVLLELATQ
jgi:hypothetical protein